MKPIHCLLLAAGFASHALAQRSPLSAVPIRPRPASAAASPGASSIPGQALYVHDLEGQLYRVHDYASAPSAVWVAHLGVGRIADIAFDTDSELFSCRLHNWPITQFYNHDAAFQGTLVSSSSAMLWANALDIDASGAAWARSGNSLGLWRLDPASGADVFMGFMPGFAAGDLAVDRDGALITTDLLGRLDRYDPASGQASVLGDHGLGPDAWGLEIDLDGVGYLFTKDGRMYALDLDTLRTSYLGDLGTTVAGAAFVRSADSLREVGVRYCSPNAVNSSGTSARIEARGSTSLAAAQLSVLATHLPPDTSGFFLGSPQRGFTPLVRGPGTLCVAPPIAFLSSAPSRASTAGTAWLDLDLAQMGLSPGDVLRVQFWYRDPAPTPTSSFSDALSLVIE